MPALLLSFSCFKTAQQDLPKFQHSYPGLPHLLSLLVSPPFSPKISTYDLLPKTLISFYYFSSNHRAEVTNWLNLVCRLVFCFCWFDWSRLTWWCLKLMNDLPIVKIWRFPIVLLFSNDKRKTWVSFSTNRSFSSCPSSHPSIFSHLNDEFSPRRHFFLDSGLSQITSLFSPKFYIYPSVTLFFWSLSKLLLWSSSNN